MIRRPSPKLAGYASLASLFLVAAVGLGRPELVVLAAPFVLVLVVGVASSRPPTWSHRSVSLARSRFVEGETVPVELHLTASRDLEWVDVITPEGTVRTLRLRAGEPQTIALERRFDRWGVYEVGGLLLRAHGRLDVFRYDDRLDARRAIKVFPRAETLRSLAPPAQTQSRAGNQVARATGEGIEFAELRPFVPGDRARSIDWRVTTRKASPWVRDQHSERNADVVIFLDTFTDAWAGGRSSSLERSVRAAASLAGAYAGQRDRIGIVSFGGILRWIEPSMGPRQVYRIVDALLDTEVAVSYAWKGIEVIPVRTLPARALVLALSPLLDERTIVALFDLRGRGFDVAAIEASPVPPAAADRHDRVASLARRVWIMEREVTRRRLRGAGVAVAEWREGEAVQAPVGEVEAFRRSTRIAHG